MKPTQPGILVKHMALCTLTDIDLSETHIITSADIVPERENILRKGGVPEEDGNMRKCNDMGKAIAAPHNEYRPISTQTYPHYQCHCYDDMTSDNGLVTWGYQPGTL